VPDLRSLISRSPWAQAHGGGDGQSAQVPTVADLARIAAAVRRSILVMTTEVNSGHPGGSLSATEALVALYYRVMRHNPGNPGWPDRDRFVMSKAHCTPVLYAVLADCGYFPTEELLTFRKLNTRLQGHSHIMVPGVEFTGGSLGQGLSYSIGLALAGRLDRKDYRVYAMIGDGECDEGSIWEAAMSASHYHVDNLTVVLDRNRIQNDRFTSEVMELEPLADKWRAFGWHVQECDGHRFGALLDALDVARQVKGNPSIVIAQTVKGKVVSIMENNPDFHGKAATPQELETALKEVDVQSSRAGAGG
jgi:transketolase